MSKCKHQYEFNLVDLPQLAIISKELAQILTQSDIISLEGVVGVGKTTFVKYLFSELGVTDLVDSPSFVLAKVYHGSNLELAHIDAYRLNSQIDPSFEEYFDYYLTVIEWASHLGNLIPFTITIRFGYLDNNHRKITIQLDRPHPDWSKYEI
jgi:tRNA threonylcarbamoyladenosine biosynthesis protein TsaE